MKQVILRSYNEWDEWYTFSEKNWNLHPSEEQTPNEYPCIMVCCEVINPHNKRDDMHYDFVYLKSFV